MGFTKYQDYAFTFLFMYQKRVHSNGVYFSSSNRLHCVCLGFNRSQNRNWKVNDYRENKA